MTTTTMAAKGGAWLLEEAAPDAVFTPEKLTDEHRLIGQAAGEFLTSEVAPALERLEQKDWALARTLLRRCGELGLLGTDVPEALGGVALDKVSSVIVGEAMGRSASFAAAFGAQTGLAITPLICFGTEEQQRRYVPRLVTGEIVGAYALSESGSGSDALGAKTRASRQPDGSFRLSGEKMWITNGGFADLFIVFAKVDGDEFSAFLVERGFPGVSTGKEEHKLGLHGSSTTPLILQDAQVPAANVLGEIGKGHKVAFNVLNYGRFKLAAMCSGGARAVVGESAKYAVERKQFGQSISSFGAIRHKLAEMAIREYAIESMLYRTAGAIDGLVDGGTTALAALEEFAIEASILKVASSEMLDFVLDENVQIHGGNGFVRDYPAERHYRDARVNRIFEGTNEINRLLVPGMLARTGGQGRAPAHRRRAQAPGRNPHALAARGARRRRAGRRTPHGGGDEEGRAHDARHGDADLWREADRRAGNPLLNRRHRHRRVRGGKRRAARDGSARLGEERGTARRRRRGVRERRGRPRRGRRAQRAVGDVGRRRAPNAARGASSNPEAVAGERRRAPPPRGGCDREREGVSFLTIRPIALALLLGLAACEVREVPYEEQIAARRTDIDRFMKSPESPVVESERAAFRSASLLPRQRGVSRAGVAQARTGGRHPRHADVDGTAAAHEAGRRARVHVEGRSAEADRVR